MTGLSLDCKGGGIAAERAPSDRTCSAVSRDRSLLRRSLLLLLRSSPNCIWLGGPSRRRRS